MTRIRRWLSSRWIWLVALISTLLLVLVYQAGWYVSGPVDAPIKADLIVPLGGDQGARVVQANRLYAAGYAPRVLLTGLENRAKQTGRHYQESRAVFLLREGVPRGAIYFDVLSRNSWEEIRNTRRLMEHNGWRTVLVVSDPPHMRRLSWVCGKVFGDSPLRYRLVVAPMPEWDPAHWWRHRVSARYVLEELIKQVYYRVVY
jgi:uncharacterized SAM-binding protein YcdF (DUF218 family)